MILNDREIVKLCQAGMITPFEPRQIRKIEENKAISFGTSSFGYDIRLGEEFKAISPSKLTALESLPLLERPIMDPKKPPHELFSDYFAADSFLVPPHGFVLTRSLEHFSIPDDTIGICLGKSTYARCGIIVNITPLEPGWRGILTIEISNTTPLPARLYVGEGIAQVIFLTGKEPDVNYNNKGGLYQDQSGILMSLISAENQMKRETRD
ncbi:dCTP deaminase [Candidatus Acetothermia bacterium]|jgi:dCTP deaminase|nr:dCTP deaminase [Candidatus Acetothermia bacterium]MCI2426265.1 dCTP deaminase [Candidatus Acetothermia bacterium]MCI2427261.1 dCTP deaminase [Candidatus Acetothermia bacterium]MCI2428533.1 dCTP deaminase [Candidatus Acetothermia bacterium]